MLHVLSIWLVVAAFFGAGVFNAIGTQANKSNFISWGYPQWWCHLTGALEMVTAVLVALPGSRAAGLILGAVIVAAAVLTVLRHRDFAHLVPLGVFAVFIVLAEIYGRA
jgi:multisubunit Na+/H+ antiporter MnhB subunit